MAELKQQRFHKIALWPVLFYCMHTSPLLALDPDAIKPNSLSQPIEISISAGTQQPLSDEVNKALISARDPLLSKPDPTERADKFTINFNNIAIAEYIRFVSKALNVNFVFDETDLQFNVTLVSEEPVSSRNVLAALIQILRIHDLSLLEQGNNYLISRTTSVTQIPTIVSSDIPDGKSASAPLITRVFKIKNVSPNSIASIIRPMMSQAALIEISNETRQLIVTDITPNVDKVAELLASLDSTHTPLEIESYSAKSISPEKLISLTTQILAPFSEGNTLILVPQLGSNTIFIVSTPYLIERAMTVLADLDVPPKREVGAPEFLIYQPKERPGQSIADALSDINRNLKDSGLSDSDFFNAIDTMKWVPSTNSLLFTGNTGTLNRIQEIVLSLDTISESAIASQNAQSFFLYKLENTQGDVVEKHLNQIADDLAKIPSPDSSLIQAIRQSKWIKESNAIFLTGTPQAIDRIKGLIAEFDVIGASSIASLERSSFFIYKPINRSAQDVEASLRNIATDLETAGLIDTQLLKTLSTMRYTAATGSLLFTGSPATLDKVKDLVAQVDIPTDQGNHIQRIGNLTFLIYKLQHASASQMMSSLKTVSGDFQKTGAADKTFSETINSMKWIKETNSILFTGPEETLQRIEVLVEKLDVPGAVIPSNLAEILPPSTFVLYKPSYQTGPELIEILKDFEQNLMTSGVVDKGLFDAINNLKWIDKTSSLLISGDSASITRVQELLHKFDIPNKATNFSSIEAIDNTSFLVYKLQYHRGQEIKDALKGIATDLGKTGSTANQALLTTINSLQWIQITNSLLGTGEAETLAKLKELIQNLDIPLRQVFIEVLVIETSLTNTQNFGLQWGGRLQYLNKFASSTGSFPIPPSSSSGSSGTVNTNGIAPGLGSITSTNTPTVSQIPFLSGFDFGVIGDIIMHKGKSFLSLGSLVNALQTDTDSTVMLNPKIITQDNNNSTIFVGSNVPYVGSLVTSTSNTVTNSTSIEYRDIGISLSITPVVGNGDVITLDIVNDISEVANNSQIGVVANQGTVTGITTTHTNMSTRVSVPDKHFLVLSGMIQDTKTHFKSQIPCLGGIPVIGLAFQENDRVNSKSNVIIFVRPHIINTFDEYKMITENQQNVYKDQAVLPVLKEQFDAAVDVVKAPEDE
jgi:type II secretory pathway component GspD/PulD (secretin)